MKKKELIVDTLKEVQLLDANRIMNSYPHQLSGGKNSAL